mgnify:CR=1 FL=1
MNPAGSSDDFLTRILSLNYIAARHAWLIILPLKLSHNWQGASIPLIESVFDSRIQICLIIGGGNIFRGIQGASEGIDRSTSDYMGMLATVINALSMQSALEKIDVPTRVQSAISMSQIAEPYIRRKAIRHLEKRRIVIFAAGTGNPFFSTDTAAALRASEMNCAMIVKGTKVDGIYDKDPIIHKDANFYKNISYIEVLNKNLKVMDSTAISLAKESKIPIIVTNLSTKNSMLNAIRGIGKFSIIS